MNNPSNTTDPARSRLHRRQTLCGAPNPLAGALALVLCLAASVTGQQPGRGDTPDDPLADVRARTTFGPAEDRAIDAWLAARIDALKAAAANDSTPGYDEVAVAAAAEFRAAFQSEPRNPASTAQYLDRLADRTAAVAVTEFASGTDHQPTMVSRALAGALHVLNQVSARDGLNAGLSHPDAAVRYLCAKSYAKLKSAIAADAATTRATIAVLKTAGAAETNGVTRGAIYNALSYDQPRHRAAAVAALIDVLAARVQIRQGGQQLRAERAELLAFEYLYTIRSNIPDAARGPLVRQLAALLTLDVQRYAVALESERRDIEERIEVCESLIEALAGRNADVRGVMKKGGVAVEEEMALELLKWVGADNQEGALNRAPWSVPAGGLR